MQRKPLKRSGVHCCVKKSCKKSLRFERGQVETSMSARLLAQKTQAHDNMTTNTTSAVSEKLWFARLMGVGNVNANNARGKGNRAARRAGWYVHDRSWWSRNTK